MLDRKIQAWETVRRKWGGGCLQRQHAAHARAYQELDRQRCVGAPDLLLRHCSLPRSSALCSGCARNLCMHSTTAQAGPNLERCLESCCRYASCAQHSAVPGIGVKDTWHAWIGVCNQCLFIFFTPLHHVSHTDFFDFFYAPIPKRSLVRLPAVQQSKTRHPHLS